MKSVVNDVDETEISNMTKLNTDTQDIVPILPIRSMVAFPQMSVPFMISFSSVAVIEAAMKADGMVGLLTIKDPEVEHPVPGQLKRWGPLPKLCMPRKMKRARWSPF